MALADDVRSRSARTLAELGAAYDYYADTKTAWRTVRRAVAAGDTFRTRNRATGTVTTQTELVAKSTGYVAEQLAAATFQQFLSIFEDYFFDLLRLRLAAYPRSLTGRKVDFEAVLDAPDKDAITLSVINEELNRVLYKRPAEWFEYLDGKVKLGVPTADEIGRIAGAKASRDVLVHNRGVATQTYEAKAGGRARYRDGQRVDISEQYHRETWKLIRKVVADVADAAVAKVS